MGADIQQELYEAAHRGDRGAVNRLLKELILTGDKDEDTKNAFAVTIDIATKNMATLSLTVLCFQGGAHGLFRHLAEHDPKEVLRIAPGLAAAFENVSFARPVLALGADKSFMEGPLLVKAITENDIETVQWMIEQGVDVNAKGEAADKKEHPFLAADSIADKDAQALMKSVIFEAGVKTAKGADREMFENYASTRQERIAADAQAQLKARQRGPGLKLRK